MIRRTIGVLFTLGAIAIMLFAVMNFGNYRSMLFKPRAVERAETAEQVEAVEQVETAEQVEAAEQVETAEQVEAADSLRQDVRQQADTLRMM